MPNASLFPFDTLEARVTSPNGTAKNAKLVVPRESDAADLKKKIDITTALQYGTAEGYPPLHAFVREFAREYLHPNVPYNGGPEVILTCGATDGFSKVVELVLETWDDGRGDLPADRQGLLCEEFTYMNAIQTARPKGVNIAPVPVDEYGMKVSGTGGLVDILENWDSSKGKKPRLMYTIATGQNPTGIVTPIERKNEIYAICQKYDILICEDEPYWHLQYHLASNGSPQSQDKEALGFLQSLVPSYLSIDVDGRVIRLDTFSKTVAPGCRLGWITAQPAIIERLTRITEVSTAQPSGFVQAMVAKMIIQEDRPNLFQVLTGKHAESSWGMSGWIRWLEELRDSYERRIQTMCQILEEGGHMVNEDDVHSTENFGWSSLSAVQIYDFKYPGGGMFAWLHMLFETHPLHGKVDEERLSKAFWLFLTQAPYLAIVAPGSMFNPLQHADEYQYPAVIENQNDRYVRLSFAAIDEDKVASSTRGFVDGSHAFWRIKDASQIDHMLKDEAAIMDFEAQIAARLC
ncbi:Pyridoxal phosphate-dependent transferase, major domain protein [Ascosphaera apis ARSEF 7405]|uniref:Pyridoxal phosphate-dependent transferase, major domain protein n=1 Tax=Ascosphaera apis ARSEF 7405 TaxID=392613 RepID=A0A167Y8E0_9EURO|nr:Pyridoxal phosphate-dependent transferase, major domain protein [Ascosphaera apis ARSEF 7405]